MKTRYFQTRYFFSPFLIRRVAADGTVTMRAPWSTVWMPSVCMLEELEEMTADHSRWQTIEVSDEEGNKIHDKPTP